MIARYSLLANEEESIYGRLDLIPALALSGNKIDSKNPFGRSVIVQTNIIIRGSDQ